MARFRYRTPVLTGKWRDSREAALRDAVKANQAQDDEQAPGGIRWLVPGEIETDGPDKDPDRKGQSGLRKCRPD